MGVEQVLLFLLGVSVAALQAAVLRGQDAARRETDRRLSMLERELIELKEDIAEAARNLYSLNARLEGLGVLRPPRAG